jgi:hypothetical protein
MFDIILVAAGIIVTQYTTIFVGGFFGIFHSKLFYIYRIENIPKPFPLKSIKILPSQIENYFFGGQTINFNYAHKTCILGKVFWQIRFWTFFCPILTFPKYFPSKKQVPLLQPVEKKFSRKLQNPLHNVVNRPS